MSRGGQRLDAAVWAVFGLVVLVAAWRVDRLENLHINPWSIPGLLPGIVGALIILLAAVLALRAPPAAPADGAGEAAQDGEAAADGAPATQVPGPDAAGGLARAFVAAVPCVLFAALGPATPLPFAADAALFIFAFIAIFSWPRWRAQERAGRGLLVAAVVAVVAALAISWLFESVFLVRLP